LAEDAALGFSAPTASRTAATAPAAARVQPAAVSARVATFSPEDLQRGRDIAAQLPARARQLATQPSTAVALVVALLLDDRADVRDRQLAAIASGMGGEAASSAVATAEAARTVPALLRLPLVSLAAPVLAARPTAERSRLIATLTALAAADDTVTLFEYCLTRLVGGYLRDVDDPARRSRTGRSDLRAAQSAALTLLAVIAAAGNADPQAAQRAFTAAAEYLMPGSAPGYAVPTDCAAALDPGWDALDALDPRYKQRLIEALVVAIRDDGIVQVAEAELLRTTCALLHCPLPAVLA
jgi:hypothetical protein